MGARTTRAPACRRLRSPMTNSAMTGAMKNRTRAGARRRRDAVMSPKHGPGLPAGGRTGRHQIGLTFVTLGDERPPCRRSAAVAPGPPAGEGGQPLRQLVQGVQAERGELDAGPVGLD